MPGRFRNILRRWGESRRQIRQSRISAPLFRDPYHFSNSKVFSSRTCYAKGICPIILVTALLLCNYAEIFSGRIGGREGECLDGTVADEIGHIRPSARQIRADLNGFEPTRQRLKGEQEIAAAGYWRRGNELDGQQI